MVSTHKKQLSEESLPHHNCPLQTSALLLLLETSCQETFLPPTSIHINTPNLKLKPATCQLIYQNMLGM